MLCALFDKLTIFTVVVFIGSITAFILVNAAMGCSSWYDKKQCVSPNDVYQEIVSRIHHADNYQLGNNTGNDHVSLSKSTVGSFPN